MNKNNFKNYILYARKGEKENNNKQINKKNN